MRLVDFIYPPRCISCFEIQPVNKLTCEECGKKLKASINLVDFHMRDVDGISLYRYTDAVRAVIRNIKYKKSLTVCKKVGKLMAEKAVELHEQTPFDLIVYIPMTRIDVRVRRFNQCEVFARIISKRLGIKFVKNVIKKTRQTEPQKSLTAAERARNLNGAFKVKKDVDGKSILLVDDVATTGSTIKENAKVLYKAGARKVTALTFAKV